jgi:hypothetical protein
VKNYFRGAIEIARGLRTNRTLLVLNLFGNLIGDLGAIEIAKTLSKFKLTHEEILKRRKIKKDRIARDVNFIYHLTYEVIYIIYRCHK